jgi:hypothetical protein
MKSTGRITALPPLLILSVLFCFGCANSGPGRPGAATNGNFFAVMVDSAPFYKYGPQQGGGPNKILHKDALVTLVRPSLEYCKVQLPTGEQGYVATFDIHAAPPALIAAANAPRRASSPAVRVGLESSEPRIVAPEPEIEPTPIPRSPASGH